MHNMCLYGHPNGTWEVNLRAEEVPHELPEAALGINLARYSGEEEEFVTKVSGLLSEDRMESQVSERDETGSSPSLLENCEELEEEEKDDSKLRGFYVDMLMPVDIIGGPAVGDIRSRCLRLSDESTSEALAVRRLLGHRLPIDAHNAKKDWYDIVEGNHSLWDGVSRPYRETIRAFLIYFQNEILRRPNDSFCFANGSIGNFFFAGARIFFQSLDAAIFLFSRVSEIPCDSLVLPVISTNDRLTLGCELQDGTIIRGQNEISHPTNGTIQTVDKRHSSTLPSKIKRVFYMSSEGNNLLHEVFPPVNPTVLEQLKSVDCIVYAMGSLFTSVCPSLVLLGVGEIISSRSCLKVLLLNGSQDRETSGFTASCFVTAIADALNRTHGDPNIRLKNPPGYYINTLFVPKDGDIAVDLKQLSEQGISDVRVVESVRDPKHGILFNPSSLINTLASLVE
ncbi:hypothetical protein F2Q69_00011338 [Brassica cretica]|uniref:Alfin N-terminal domain-containing protein n=1 Tax=Brassica cretica TaxID=69181 RepID=A0A8S9QMW4_BRACR|nr:hypothetical protein F2Q69_00011338 [Brassica cretica]